MIAGRTDSRTTTFLDTTQERTVSYQAPSGTVANGVFLNGTLVPKTIAVPGLSSDTYSYMVNAIYQQSDGGKSVYSQLVFSSDPIIIE